MTRFLYLISTLLIFSCSDSPEHTAKKNIGSERVISAIKESNPDQSTFFDYDSRIDWKEHEIDLDFKTKKVLISKFDDLFSYVKESEYHKEKYDSMFHFLHLNSDTLIDVIYEGWSGGEPDVSKFFYNVGDKFQLKFEASQYISDLSIKDGRLQSFKTVDFGCCAEYVEWENFYNVNNDSLHLIYKRAKINQTIKPKTYFNTAKKFIVKNSPYYLRYEPNINDDELYSPWMESIGNRVALYNKGDKGFAFAEKTDSTGRIWWFVEMQEKTNIQYNIIYESETNKSKYLGWMSSRFLKEIN
jgi:hypothetical protein